jgi:hypothetical protein
MYVEVINFWEAAVAQCKSDGENKQK